MTMENSDFTNVAENEPYVDLTKPISNWFKPSTAGAPKTISPTVRIAHAHPCKSIIGCTSLTLRGFDFCHKHILEDKDSPFLRCSYISKTDYKRCRNPTPILGEKRAFCTMHEKDRSNHQEVSNKTKNKKKKKHPSRPHEKGKTKRPSTLPVTSSTRDEKREKLSSSDEEEFSFFTDTVQVNKTDCLWLGNQASDAESTDSEDENVMNHAGNQASDAESTDSEDENVMNHAGVWTVEECLRILKEKLSRIRHLYALQYKRLNYCLKEERRKMLKEYDMDTFTLSKVGFEGCSDASFEKFVEGVHLTNYQKHTGPELMAEKLWREKRSKGVSLHSRRNDLPRCMLYTDGQRCSNKMLPLSKYCYSHVCNDPDQHLFTICTYKHLNGKKCTEPSSSFTATCYHHRTLPANESYKKSFELFNSAKQRCENRKRKLLEKEREKKEPVRAKRSSARLKECTHDEKGEKRLSHDIQNESNVFEKGLFHYSSKSSDDQTEVAKTVVDRPNTRVESSPLGKKSNLTNDGDGMS